MDNDSLIKKLKKQSLIKDTGHQTNNCPNVSLIVILTPTNLIVPEVHDGDEHGVGEEDGQADVVETEVNKFLWVLWST